MGAPECIIFVRLAEDDEGLAHLDRLPDAEWCSVEDRGRKAGKKDRQDDGAESISASLVI